MCGNGHIIIGTPIAVDLWNKKSYPQACIFFLSHFHSDHVVGLSKSWEYPIYTSTVTGELIENFLGVKSSLIRKLEMEEDHLIPLDNKGKEMATVRLFDANHCPGAVMFLFHGYFGNILYTGDFRYAENILNFDDLPPDIDALYLDNTYCTPKCVFPSKEDAMAAVLEKVNTCLQKSKRVFIGMDNLGKEELLVNLSRETHSKICVSDYKKKILDILGFSDIITTDEANAKIFVVSNNQINSRNVEKWNTHVKTCVILTTAKFCGFNFKPYSNNNHIHVFPYSSHSSYLELMEFVQRIRPHSIIPIIGKQAKGLFGADISERADMSVFCDFLSDVPRCDFAIPETVKNIMNMEEKNDIHKKHKKRKRENYKFKKKEKNACGIIYIDETNSSSENGESAVPMSTKEVSTTSSTSERSEQVWEITCIYGNTVHKIRRTTFS